MLATGLVEVGLPCWCWRQCRVTVPAAGARSAFQTTLALLWAAASAQCSTCTTLAAWRLSSSSSQPKKELLPQATEHMSLPLLLEPSTAFDGRCSRMAYAATRAT